MIGRNLLWFWLLVSPAALAFEPLPLGAPQHEVVGSGPFVEVLVNPVYIVRFGDYVDQSEIDQYFLSVGQYLSNAFERKAGQTVEVELVPHTGQRWERPIRKRIKVGDKGGKAGGPIYRSFDFTITNAVHRFRIKMDGLTHSDVVDVTQELHRRIEKGMFGPLFRTEYAKLVYRGRHTNFLKNDLRVSIEGYVDQ